MTDHQKLNEIISLLTFLQTHIQNNVDQSFTDLTFNLETVIKDYLNVFKKSNEHFENINNIQHNYPAIDLLNRKRDIALQVTTNANLKKVRETLATYKRHKLAFSKLIVIGFVASTKATLPNVTVYGTNYLIELAKFGSSSQKDEVYEILRKQIPWNSLTPLSDAHCFDIVFDTINRSAVRDFTGCEGSFDRMVDGMSEIKEIITTGKIKGKSIRAKALVEYTKATHDKLSEIEFLVSNIIQVCNANKNKSGRDFLCLDRKETELIDTLKEQIINKTNELALSLNLTKKIVGSRR